MKIYVCRKPKKDGNGTYLALEARAEWGRVLITFNSSTILELLPYGIDHRTLNADGICIGSLNNKAV